MITRTDTLMEMDWRVSPDYAKALEHLDSGQWNDAASMIGSLLEAHPGDSTLQSMLSDAQLRLETERVHKVRARRLVFPNRRVTFVFLLVAVLVALGWLARSFYSGVIVPSMAASQAAKEQEAVATQAHQALASGDYNKALDLYDQLADLNPNHPALVDGVREAQEAIDLAAKYDLAQQQLADNQITDAQATLVSIQAQAPTYRDAGVLLAKIERRQRLAGLRRQVADAMDAANWEEAVTRLEEARNLSPQEDQDSIAADLFASYVAYAGQMVDNSEGRPAELTRAVELYNKALSLQPQEAQAETQRQWARQYLAGYDAFTGGNWDEAMAQLEPLYAAQPGYVSGKAAQLLYDAYVHSAQDLLKSKEINLAWERYFRASQLKGVDTTTARALAASLATNMTPTPLPTITPTPKPVATPRPAQVPGGSGPTASLGSGALSNYVGKIVFLRMSNSTSELWIMDSDGRNAFKLKNQGQALTDYGQLRTAEMVSPDGTGTLSVVQPPGEGSAQIVILHEEGGYTRVTSLGGTSYDPVWSPTGHWIAFVSNYLGSDDIYTIGADGQNLKRLTNNTWEWDKHPSWSPDGSKLVFWSNRDTGHGQIWSTKPDGSAQINLSNNTFDEQDPIWIK